MAVTTPSWQMLLLDQLTDRLTDAPGVLELWVLGSVSEDAMQHRWSDLDVGIVAESAAVERLAEVRDWLPDADRVGLVSASTPNGEVIRRVVFDDLRFLDIFFTDSADTLRRPRRRLRFM